MKRCRLYVVKTQHGDILGHTQARIVESPDGAHGRDVVEAEDGGKLSRPLEQIMHLRIADLGRGGIDRQLDKPNPPASPVPVPWPRAPSPPSEAPYPC